MDIQEIVEAVNSIEQDIFNSTNEEYYNISLVTNGNSSFVKFCGIDLWDSEEDQRQYLDVNDEGKRESIEDCLRRRLREELSVLNTIIV